MTKLTLSLQTRQYDSILGGQSSVAPLDMPLDISPLYVPDAEMIDLYTDSWLNSTRTDLRGWAFYP